MGPLRKLEVCIQWTDICAASADLAKIRIVGLGASSRLMTHGSARPFSWC